MVPLGMKTAAALPSRSATLALESADQLAFAVPVRIPTVVLAPFADAHELGTRRAGKVARNLDRTAFAQRVLLRRGERIARHLPPGGVSIGASMRSLLVCIS